VEEKDNIFLVTMGILHLGNIKFEAFEGSSDSQLSQVGGVVYVNRLFRGINGLLRGVAGEHETERERYW
jgi:hypothetical protein